MPSIQKLYEELEDRDDIVILAMNSGADTKEVVEKYWAKEGFDFPALLDDRGSGSNTEALGAMAFPTNLVVGPDGKVRFASVGFDEATIRKHLGL